MDELKGWHSRGYAPHFDGGEIYQFITFRLHDSVPNDLIQSWKDELFITDDTLKGSEEYIKLQKKIIKFLDKGYGACYLKSNEIAKIVENALKFHDKDKYELIDWVVMPNHVHVLIRVNPNYSLTKIVHSWKSFTANEANKVLKRHGAFWMRDYYDRYIRDDKHYQATIEYIEKNRRQLL